MKIFLFLILPSLFVFGVIKAQDPAIPSANSTDYYYQIPSYPESYSSETVTARMIDGLGFRYYWATEGLTEPDLKYHPNEEGRSTSETMDHIFGMSFSIINAIKSKPNTQADRSGSTEAEKRRITLENFKKAGDLLKAGETSMENMKAIFGTAEFPFWNMINGPISDCIYHTGQIVSFRRSSGNPIDSNISVFQGKKRE
jgi:hypothetical protein